MSEQGNVEVNVNPDPEVVADPPQAPGEAEQTHSKTDGVGTSPPQVAGDQPKQADTKVTVETDKAG